MPISSSSSSGLSSGQLAAFRVLAQVMNFTQASKKLGLTQSALSQRILNLESELGTTLFIRDPAGTRLTEAAHDLLRYCQTKDALEAEVLNRLQGGRHAENLAGTIRIAGFSSVMGSVILPRLSKLVIQNPGLKLNFLTRELQELPELLKNGATDFIITDQASERSEIESFELGKEQNVLVERKDYRGPDVYLDHDEDDQTTFRYLKLAAIKAKSIQRLYLDDVHGILNGVRLGLGRAVLPLHLIQEEKQLHVLHPEKVLKSPYYLSYYRQPFYSKLHQGVVSALVVSQRG